MTATKSGYDSDVAQLGSSPQRRYYRGSHLHHAQTITDLRARAHRRMPRFVLEYLEAGAGAETTLAREQQLLRQWLFVPHMLRDVAGRDPGALLLGQKAAMPLAIAPTGLNGLFQLNGDLALARAAAAENIPFIQSTMSNDPMAEVAAVPGLRHWWQLYVFGGEAVWQELVARADAAGCEALVLTVNAQIFGQRNWSSRERIDGAWPTVPAMLDAARHPRWAWASMRRGFPVFANAIDFIPRDKRGFFDSAQWIRDAMPKSLSWQTVAAIRQRWQRPFFIKGLLHPDDVRRARDAGADGVILGTHGGRQLDDSVAALDMIAQARKILGEDRALYMSGGIRRGVDVLKAVALGADGVLAGRAPLYGLCAGGEAGARRALEILRAEMNNAMGQLGISRLSQLSPDMLRQSLPGGDRADGI